MVSISVVKLFRTVSIVISMASGFLESFSRFQEEKTRFQRLVNSSLDL